MSLHRRVLLAAACLAGCAAEPAGPGAATDPQALRAWRTLQGGFLAPAVPGPGLPALAPRGAFMRWMAPTALALRGSDLLVADLGSRRLWRADSDSQAITGIAGAPVGPGTALALGLDLSAWVLDAAAHQVLRFGRDGRLLQTRRIGTALPDPVALALVDGGATLLLADGMGAQWAEQRGPSGLWRQVAPEREGGQRIAGADALATGRDNVFVLDRQQGVVHQVARNGQVRHTLGAGGLRQPVALAVDGQDRVYVLDAHDQSLKRLQAGAPAHAWSASELGVQKIGGIAIDGLLLAVSDMLRGQVLLWRLPQADAS